MPRKTKSPALTLGFFINGDALKKLLTIASMCIALSACSSSGSFKIPEIAPDVPRIQFENMFLRGVFNWWEADPSYKFKRSNSGWTVDVELIADGQPYDFRLSDAKWTPSQSCGGKYKGQPVMLGSTVYLVCEQGSENLQFTPSSTGTYRFTATAASAGEVALVVSKL